MKSHFKKFFACPECGAAQAKKESFAEHYAMPHTYCGMCGKEIATAWDEAAAEICSNEND